MTHPEPVAVTAADSDVVRDLSGEAVCGFRVAAWRETHPEHGDTYGHAYSEHWSTPNTRHPEVIVERLFTETQLRDALARTPPPNDAAPVGDTFGALTTALYDLDNTARLGDNPSAVATARERAKTLLDWMRRHGVTVAPLRADDDALGDAVVKVRATWKYLGGHKYTFETAALELLIARAQSGGVREAALEAVRHECTQYVRNCGMNASDLAERIRALLPAPPATEEGK